MEAPRITLNPEVSLNRMITHKSGECKAERQVFAIRLSGAHATRTCQELVVSMSELFANLYLGEFQDNCDL